MTRPFYACISTLYSDNQRFECRYFKSAEEAAADAKEGGGWVVETTPGKVWRSTFPI